jgi:hypothetical protein
MLPSDGILAQKIPGFDSHSSADRYDFESNLAYLGKMAHSSPSHYDEQWYNALDFASLQTGAEIGMNLEHETMGCGLNSLPLLLDSCSSELAPTPLSLSMQFTPPSPPLSLHRWRNPPAAAENQAVIGQVIALSEIVQHLEAYVLADITEMDKIMQINKACIASIINITAGTDYTRCRSWPNLLFSVMDLIVTLYEGGFRARDQSSQPRHAMGGSHRVPNLSFGGFQIDPDEQLAIRNRIFSLEIGKCRQFVRKLRQLTSASSNESSAPRIMALSSWYDDMEKRIDSLMSAY